MEKFDVRACDSTFLVDATEQLLVARKRLAWSYVFGYYLSLDEQRKTLRSLFEFVRQPRSALHAHCRN